MTASTPGDDPADDEPIDDELVEEQLTAEERQQLIQELERRRSPRGIALLVVAFIGVAFSTYQVWLAARGFEFVIPNPFGPAVDLGSLQLLQINAIHVAFGLVLTFLLFPPLNPEGAVVRRLVTIVPGLADRLGPTHPVTRTARGGRSVVRWAFADPERQRITPVDLVLAGLSIWTAIYMVYEFDEIRRLRVFGMGAGRPIGEVYPLLEPISAAFGAIGVPIDEVSFAFILGVIGVLMVLEATRRALGIYLMVIVASFIVYARFGYLIPRGAPYVGVLSIPRLNWGSIIQNLWYNTENGVFGIPVTVSVQFIYIFILFGAFLEMSGAGQWFIDLAYSATGKRKGGPAKASILASGFMGTISGSSIANTVTTGAFTIPLMKRTGYRPEFAGAVEASASAGGQILPPVMGAAAFLIVEFTLTPYADVIVAAAVPAIVFFFGVWVMVHLEASRTDIGVLETEDMVNFRAHFARGWFYLVPLVLLMYYLIVERLSVARSAWFTLVAIVALIAFVAAYNRRTRWPLLGTVTALFLAEFWAFFTAGVDLVGLFTGASDDPLALGSAMLAAAGEMAWLVMAISVVTLLAKPRMEAPLLDYDQQVDDISTITASKLRRPQLQDNRAFTFGTFVLRSMDGGARTATTVVIAVAAAGIIPGVISATGLGPNLTSLIRTVAGGSIVALLVVTAIASIILGMGMPTTVTYIILVSMLGPAIASPEFGIPILAAHLFILYFGVIADITPPVAVAAYAASGIAKSDQFWTGVQAFALSLNKAIVPFAFVLSPGILLLRGTGTGEEVRVIGLSDMADLGFFIPEVLIPILGVFVGVIALGATVIGYLYTNVNRVERGLYAVSALLLMAPGLLFNPVLGLLGLVGFGVEFDPLVLDIALRAVGLALLGVLVVKNRREAETPAEGAPAPA